MLADNVTINFEGYSLMGSGSGRGLFIGGAGVTIKNGTIRGFGTGADPEAGFGQVRTTFSKMTITGNGDGISGCDVGLLTVQSTSVVGNGGWGINQGCSGAVFVTAGSRVLRNNAGGIAGGGASGGVSVDDSFVSENGGYGIYEVNQGVRLTNSFFSGNPILDFSTYGDLFTVKGNKFRNSPLIPLDTVSIVDLGGNLCAVGTAPFLPCVFP